MPLVTPEKAAEQWSLFEALKAKLLGVDDYQSIAGKRYIKRSGFRKIAVYFGISDRIIKEERTERDDGSFTWRIIVEAFAPNSRCCVGVGACDSRERKFAHLEHDVYSTAHTRAKSRAISDLVAGGAVSAEEVSEELGQDDEPTALATPQEASGAVTSDSEQHVPIVKDTVKMDGLRQFPLTDGLRAVGMMNVFDKEISVVPEKPLKKDGATISGFLVPRILDPLCEKHKFSYQIASTPDGYLTHILILGRLSDAQIKDLQTASRWAFTKAIAEAA